MKYFKLPENKHYSCSFPIGSEIYTATVRTLSTGNRIWSVRNQEGSEIFKNINLVTGVNYAGIFSGFGENKILKYFETNGRGYLGTEETDISNN
jgi:hypothetical protein